MNNTDSTLRHGFIIAYGIDHLGAYISWYDGKKEHKKVFSSLVKGERFLRLLEINFEHAYNQ